MHVQGKADTCICHDIGVVLTICKWSMNFGIHSQILYLFDGYTMWLSTVYLSLKARRYEVNSTSSSSTTDGTTWIVYTANNYLYSFSTASILTSRMSICDDSINLMSSSLTANK